VRFKTREDGRPKNKGNPNYKTINLRYEEENVPFEGESELNGEKTWASEEWGEARDREKVASGLKTQSDTGPRSERAEGGGGTAPGGVQGGRTLAVRVINSGLRQDGWQEKKGGEPGEHRRNRRSQKKGRNDEKGRPN